MPEEAQFAPPEDDPLRKATPAVDDVEARRARAAIEGRLFSGPAPRVKVGRYRVLGKIGAGGMGVVYKAHDPDLARDVAVKLMNNEAVGDADTDRARGRLVREARAMARLAHPNVIHVYDVGTVEDGVFIAMELVEGESLRAWLEAAPRTWKEALLLFIEAGRGLAAAHEAGVIHRDFKPENVLVGADGRVRVGDFGLAGGPGSETGRHASAAESGDTLSRSAIAEALTRTGALLGTPKYMAPEQETGLAATARSDQFSFCVALYEALYGRAPYPGHSVIEYRRAVREGKVRAPGAPAGVPAWVGDVLLQGLSADSADRHTTMGGLLDRLSEALEDPVEVAATKKRRRVPWIVAGTALLAGAVVLGSMLGPAPKPAEVVTIDPQIPTKTADAVIPDQEVFPPEQPPPAPPEPAPAAVVEPKTDVPRADAAEEPEAPKRPIGGTKEQKSRKRRAPTCYWRKDRPYQFISAGRPKDGTCLYACTRSADPGLVPDKGVDCSEMKRCNIDPTGERCKKRSGG